MDYNLFQSKETDSENSQIKFLSEEANKIRRKKKSRRFVWPEGFKTIIIESIREGTSIKHLSTYSGIAVQTLKSWVGSNKKSLKKYSNTKFKELKVVDEMPANNSDFTVRGINGNEISGMNYSDICKLLKEGIL